MCPPQKTFKAVHLSERGKNENIRFLNEKEVNRRIEPGSLSLSGGEGIMKELWQFHNTSGQQRNAYISLMHY